MQSPPFSTSLPSSNTTYQRVTFFLISALLHLLCPLPWFVNSSFCSDSILAEPCYTCIWPLPVGTGHLGLLRPASCSLLCGWLTCKSSSLIRTVSSPPVPTQCLTPSKQAENSWMNEQMLRRGSWPLSETNLASFQSCSWNDRERGGGILLHLVSILGWLCGHGQVTGFLWALASLSVRWRGYIIVFSPKSCCDKLKVAV